MVLTRAVSTPARAFLVAGAGYLALAFYSWFVQNLEFGGQAFWPPSGWTFALLLLAPRRCWPAILAAVGLAELGSDLYHGISATTGAIWALADMAEPLLAAFLARRLIKRYPLGRARLLAVLGCGVCIGPLVGGTLGGIGLIHEFGGAATIAILSWTVGDMLGVAVLAPVLLFSVLLPAPVRRPSRSASLMLGALFAGLLPASMADLATAWAELVENVTFVSLVVIALVLGFRPAALATAAFAFSINLATALGTGLYSRSDLGYSGWITLQVHIAGLLLVTLVTALLSNEAQMHLFRSESDRLTGVGNRAALERRLDELRQRAAPDSQRASDSGLSAAFFVDIDHFKEVNDSFGHEVGDRVLCEVARRLSATARSRDAVVRLGGDEFVVLMEGFSDLATASAFSERVGTELARPVPVGLERPLAVTASVGYAVGTGPSDVDILIERADTAMYEAKRASVRPAPHLVDSVA